MTYKNMLFSFILTAAVGIAVWTTFTFSHSTPLVPSSHKVEPDTWMEEVTATFMDKYGKPKMKIVTPKMVHYPEQDVMHLESPQLTLYRQSPTPWYVTARFAETKDGIATVKFIDDVVIHHAAVANNPATLIKTSTLTVYPHQQTAETAALITLLQPGLTVQAIGMQANMNNGDIKLLSQARGEYVPAT